ncbi:MAG: molybdenum cofactor guanylyltransferase [Methylophaga sp.]|nr:MAG: molybdenum cofactor guanylyltransferase [Methylophaga sp.]
MKTSFSPSITGVILAGGKARRMGGQDKGLIAFNNKPLIRHVIDIMMPQIDDLIINANRNIELYQNFGYAVIADSLDDFCGPLAGMLSAMQFVDSDYILTAPCDAPMISPQYRQRMMETLLNEQADIAVASDGDRLQPVFSLIPTRLQHDLAQYLAKGDRKIDRWFEQYKLAVVDFSDQPESFANFNCFDDIEAHQKTVSSPIPVLGFAAFSGTGKTTLLRQLIPVLNAKGIQLAVIKHAHHRFDIDIPGKDSYEIRKAGAQQVLVSSRNLMALMEVQASEMIEPQLNDLIPRINTKTVDLILVEGFKDESFPKIELHRPSIGKPLLHPNDDNIIAIATDAQTNIAQCIDQLDLNDIQGLADYIQTFIANWTR